MTSRSYGGSSDVTNNSRKGCVRLTLVRQVYTGPRLRDRRKVEWVLDSRIGHGVVCRPGPLGEMSPVTESPGYRPLYRQVYDIVVRRVAEGKWRPGEALPSEQNLAREMGVSQGTMRKVLDSLTAEKLLERRQGKGTFIAENTQESDRVRDQHRGRTRRAQTRACDRGG